MFGLREYQCTKLAYFEDKGQGLTIVIFPWKDARFFLQ